MAKKQFKAESKRLLDLMINSIYTHKEIFLRELISNASDAVDKLYYNAMKDGISGIDRGDLDIFISVDKEKRTLTISDKGCGMTENDLNENLGVIAKSGSLAFKKAAAEKDGKALSDVDIIGQFGVGFYSAFMVAEKVEVLTRAEGSEQAYLWQSEGVDGYTVTPAEKDSRGTDITLYLKPDTEDENYSEYLEEYTLRRLIKKYSDYIRYPIKMLVTKSRKKEGCPDDKPEWEDYTEVETVNSMTPIWKKQKSEVTDEEYSAFYKEKFMDYEDPARVIRSNVEGNSTYTALMFIPQSAPYNYYTKDYEKGLQLYANGVLIMDKCADLLPDYFSFVKGLVDSQDLSLNISREMLQHDRQLKLIASGIEKKIKNELGNMLENDREKYEAFFKAFGLNLKYGLYSDYGMHKDVLKDLVIFYSSTEKKEVTLKEYVGRMTEQQKYIYYAAGETTAKLDMMPQAEGLKEKGIEILYLTDDVDEFCLRSLHEYDGKEFKNICDGDLGLETEEEKEAAKQQNEDNKELLAAVKDALDGKVAEVRLSSKLKSHPVCLSSEGGLSIEMEKVLNSMPNDQKVQAQRILELNASHPVFAALSKLFADGDTEKLKKYAGILYNQALLIEGLPIDDPVAYANDVCELM